LAAVLNDEDEQLVVGAIRSLEAINAPEAGQPLVRLIKDPRAVVRQAAADALGKLPL
jgi:HEAT repeat protein